MGVKTTKSQNNVWGKFDFADISANIQEVTEIPECQDLRVTDSSGVYGMESGNMGLDRCIHHTGSMDFLLFHYQGITVGFQTDPTENPYGRL